MSSCLVPISRTDPTNTSLIFKESSQAKKKLEEKKGIYQLADDTAIHLLIFLKEEDITNFSQASKTLNDWAKQTLPYWQPRFRSLGFRACQPEWEEADGKNNTVQTTKRICKVCLCPWEQHEELVKLAPTDRLEDLLSHHQNWYKNLFPEMEEYYSSRELEHVGIRQYHGFEDRQYLISKNRITTIDNCDEDGKVSVEVNSKDIDSDMEICASARNNDEIVYVTAKKNKSSRYSLDVSIWHKDCSDSQSYWNFSLASTLPFPSMVAFDPIFPLLFLVIDGRLGIYKQGDKVYEGDHKMDECGHILRREIGSRSLDCKVTSISYFPNHQYRPVRGSVCATLVVGTQKGEVDVIFFYKATFTKIPFSNPKWNKPIISIVQIPTDNENIKRFYFDRFKTEVIEVNAAEGTAKMLEDPAPLSLKQMEGKEGAMQSKPLPADLYQKNFMKSDGTIFTLTPKGTLVEHTLKRAKNEENAN